MVLLPSRRRSLGARTQYLWEWRMLPPVLELCPLEMTISLSVTHVVVEITCDHGAPCEQTQGGACVEVLRGWGLLNIHFYCCSYASAPLASSLRRCKNTGKSVVYCVRSWKSLRATVLRRSSTAQDAGMILQYVWYDTYII